MTNPGPGAAIDYAIAALADENVKRSEDIHTLAMQDVAQSGRLADLEARVTSIQNWIKAQQDGVPPTPTQPPARTVSVTEPTAVNTGGGAARTRSKTNDGDLICVPNGIYEDILVKGHVVLAPGCQVRRVTATGRPKGGAFYSALFWGVNATGAIVEDCVARPSQPFAAYLNGFGWSGKGYTARWNDVSGVSDLFHGAGDDMTIEANYAHDYAFWAVDPDQGGSWNHPDGVQCLGGANLKVYGNSFWMNADPQLSQGLEALQANVWYKDKWGGGYGNIITLTFSTNIKNWTVAQNWMRGGEVQLQMPKVARGFDTGNDGALWGNRVYVDTCNAWHGGTSSTSKHHFRQDVGTGVVTTDTGRPNINVADGKPLPGTYQPQLSVKSPA